MPSYKTENENYNPIQIAVPKSKWLTNTDNRKAVEYNNTIATVNSGDHTGTGYRVFI